MQLFLVIVITIVLCMAIVKFANDEPKIWEFIKNLWPKKQIPQVGEIWIWQSENPFQLPLRVRILDVKKNWVKYSGDGNEVTDRIAQFIQRYEKEEDK